VVPVHGIGFTQRSDGNKFKVSSTSSPDPGGEEGGAGAQKSLETVPLDHGNVKE